MGTQTSDTYKTVGDVDCVVGQMNALTDEELNFIHMSNGIDDIMMAYNKHIDLRGQVGSDSIVRMITLDWLRDNYHDE